MCQINKMYRFKNEVKLKQLFFESLAINWLILAI